MSIEEELRKLLANTDVRWKKPVVRKNIDFLIFLETRYPLLPLNQQIYLFENNIDNAPRCKVCTSEVYFHSYKHGYRNTCSAICLNKLWKMEGRLKSITKNREDTNLIKYGCKNPTQNEEIKNKRARTNIERYGHAIATYNEIIKSRIAATSMKKYGRICHTQRHISDNTLATLDDKDSMTDLLSNMDAYGAADLLGVAQPTVCRYARKHGIYDGRRSNVERVLFEWLDTLGLEFKTDRTVLKKIKNGKSIGYEIDRLCLDERFGIELDGLVSHSEILGEKDKHYHKWKTDECEKQGIRLIHIFEDEWYDRREAVQDIIKTQLGIQEKGIGARKLQISDIDNRQADKFLEQYHIQGGGSFQVCIGAFHKEVLVGAMGFGKPTRQSKYQYELKRYCTDGKIYPGLASRLFQYFIKQYNPKSIVSFCDRRYFSGESYLKMGFRYDGLVPPDYCYTLEHRYRHHKSGFRLSNIRKKFSNLDMEGKTEWECMRELGYDRVWDCGKKRFVWTDGAI